MRKVTTYLLAGSVAIAGAVGVARATAYSATASAQPRKEMHPMIHAAIGSLQKARAELVAAAHDFGGHKADAIKAVDAAIKQLRLADAYDAK